MTALAPTRPNPAIDAAVDDMWHSLLDGRAKHRYQSTYDPTGQDKESKAARARITLAPITYPSR